MSNQIQNKLLQFEEQPPAGAWDEIAAALDGGAVNEFAEKLYSFEQIPSRNTWNKINDQLNTNDPKLVPFFKKYSRPLKYSTAVAALVVLAVLVSLLVSKRSGSENISSTIGGSIKKAAEDTLITVHNTDLQKISVARLETEKPVKHVKLQKARNSFWLGPEPTLRSVASLNNLAPEVASRTTAIDYTTPVDKYMIYSDGDGKAVRLSKKLYDDYACATDRINCRQKIKKLQEQAASAAMKSDFTGILDILNKLEENQ